MEQFCAAPKLSLRKDHLPCCDVHYRIKSSPIPHQRFPLDGIAPGEYIIKMSLISGTPRGRTTYYDTILDVSRFIITDDPAVNDGFIWSERLWGNMRLAPLEIL